MLQQEFWVARDKEGDILAPLTAYNKKPVRYEDVGRFGPDADPVDGAWAGEDYFEMDPSCFPQVTWANSPVKVSMSIINN